MAPKTTLFNLIDSTTPFELVIGPPGTVGRSPSGPAPFSSRNVGSGRCGPATGRLTPAGIARLTLGMKRTTARRTYQRWSTRGTQTMDFYCLKPTGISAGYPAKHLLRAGAKNQRRALQGRIVMLLTANHRYALNGVRVGARFAKVAGRLHAGRRFRRGTSYWYFTPNGSSHGVVKVHHGIIVEIGIANKQLASTVAQKRRFLISFWPFV